ncbi:RtcB family protein [Streptomyces sp. S.PB5]|nr:RtcB family protein [Streptomyces sp. S.PB5]MDN3028983.1 RtcB family protein [Streptomyces sp. S.PB5]
MFMPGTMGTASYVMTGIASSTAFGSLWHSAGRLWSRHHAVREVTVRQLQGS